MHAKTERGGPGWWLGAVLLVASCGGPSDSAVPTGVATATQATATAVASASATPIAEDSSAVVVTSAEASASASSSAPQPVSITYSPPNPWSVAATLPPGFDFDLHPMAGGLLAVVMKKNSVRSFVIVQGDNVREARELMKGMPSGKPTAFTGKLPDSLFMAHKKSVYAWDKDHWTEVAKAGPYEIARWSTGVATFKPDATPLQFEIFGAPGSSSPEKLEAPPVRDAKCPMRPGVAATLEGGEIVILGSACQTKMVMETWMPKTKQWSPSRFDDVGFGGSDSRPTVLSPSQLSLVVYQFSGDGEPLTSSTTLMLNGGKWKHGKVVGRFDAPSPSKTVDPFAPKKGDTYELSPGETVSAGGKSYFRGELTEEKVPKAIVLIANYKIDSPAAVAP